MLLYVKNKGHLGLTADFFLQFCSKEVSALSSFKLLELRGMVPEDQCRKVCLSRECIFPASLPMSNTAALTTLKIQI